MKMTQDQAITYCSQKAQSSLDGTPAGKERSILWQSLHQRIEQKGLQVVEEECTAWRDHHTGIAAYRTNQTWIVYGTFLIALDDQEEIERLLARTLIERVAKEQEQQESQPLRAYYLSCLRQHLVSVRDGYSNLQGYEEVRSNIEDHLRVLESFYGKWIDDAIQTQE